MFINNYINKWEKTRQAYWRACTDVVNLKAKLQFYFRFTANLFAQNHLSIALAFQPLSDQNLSENTGSDISSVNK